MENAIGEHTYILPPEEAPAQLAPQSGPMLVAQPLPPNSVLVKPPLTRPDNFVVMEGQMAELDRYRRAVQKMGHDIVALRERIRVIEGENSMLRRDLAAYNDTSKILLDSVELDGLPKSDLISRYGELELEWEISKWPVVFKFVQKFFVDLWNEFYRNLAYIWTVRTPNHNYQI